MTVSGCQSLGDCVRSLVQHIHARGIDVVLSFKGTRTVDTIAYCMNMETSKCSPWSIIDP